MLGGLQFTRRFLLLMGFGFVLAVAIAVGSVWLAARPVLARMQADAVSERVAQVSQAMRIALQSAERSLRLVASNPLVVSSAMGDDGVRAATEDFLASFHGLEGLRWIGVTDILANRTIETSLGGDLPALFRDEKVLEQAVHVLEGRTPLVPMRDEVDPRIAAFVIAVPILRRGHVEGVLQAKILLDLSQIFEAHGPSGHVWLTTIQDVAPRPGRAFRKVGDTGLTIAMDPDPVALTLHARTMIASVMGAVSLGLIVPFLAIAWLGHAALVAPHKALQQSRVALKRQERRLSELAALAERSNDAMLVTDLDERIQWTNAAFERLSGYALEDVLGQRPADVLHGPDTDPDTRRQIREAISAGEPIKTEILNYHRDGSSYWAELRVSPVLGEDGRPDRLMATAVDVTEERARKEALIRAKKEVEHQANHDPLTGLPNRRALDDELRRRAEAGPGPVHTLVRIDLDHFKYVNDTLGHEAGDQVLCQVGDVLRDQTREGDVPARIGGDEFVVLLAPDRGLPDGAGLASRLLPEIRRPINHNGRRARVGSSFGVASTDGELISTGELLGAADTALYVAKDEGRNRVVTYGPELHIEAGRKRRLATEIEAAVRQCEFVPFFQPQFDAETLEFCGMEALLRWPHPTRGLLSPADFLPVAQQLALVGEIDRIVFEHGLTCVTKMARAGHVVPKVSFNIEASRLLDPDLPGAIAAADFGETKVALEVLESVLMEERTGALAFQIDRLKDLDVSIEVDDFGSGHASVIGLMSLSPDRMKIDQRLVRPLTMSSSARQMVRALLEIGRSLGIAVTAEGVEEAEHATLLAEMGCDTLQGYWLARPMAADDLIMFLNQYDPAEMCQRRTVMSDSTTGGEPLAANDGGEDMSSFASTAKLLRG